MKKRTFVRAISLCFAVIIALTGFLIKERQMLNKYKLQLQNEYSYSLSELNSRLNNISLILEKAIYITGTPQLSSLSAELYSESELAKEALSKLPAGEKTLDTINRFLSQVGNYALSVSKSYITNKAFSDEQRRNLNVLSETAATVSDAVADSHLQFNNGNYWQSVLDSKIESINDASLASSLTELEENLTDYPTLIYDGPYSDHILTKKPLMTTNAEEIGQNKALNIAIEFSSDKNLKASKISEGKIPSYNFSSDFCDIAVSKNGGYVVYMRKNNDGTTAKLTVNQAISRAKNFLNKNGFDKMQETYYFTQDNVCVINFAYLDGQTICYTDLIKVGISLDSGDTVFFESSGYLTNHSIRAFETAKYTAEEAERSLNASLDVKSVSMVLIPTDSGGEIRCYEFSCRGRKNEEILAYVNIKTLQNEQIFIVLKTDGGTLVK